MASDPVAVESWPQRSRLRRFVKVAGGVVATLVVLDLVATVITIAIGAEILKR